MKKYFNLPTLVLYSLCLCISCGDKSEKQLERLEEAVQAYAELNKPDGNTYWPDLSEKYFKKQTEGYEVLLEKIDKVDYDHLSEAKKIDIDLLKLIAEDELFNLQFNTQQMPLNAEGGFLINMLYNVQNRNTENAEDYKTYLDNLKSIPAYFNQRIQDMKAGQEINKSSPKVVVKNCLNIIDNWLGTKVESSFYMNPVKKDSVKSKEVQTILSNEVLPAYVDLRNYLANEYLAKAPDEVGISAIDNGKSFYEQRVKYYTTFEISPQQVFDKGMEEVKRIRKEMDQIIVDLEYEGSFKDFLEFLRTDPQFYAKSAQELLHHAAWITKKMEGKLPEYFNKLPRMPLTVKPVPDAIAPTYTTGRYSPGSYKQNKAGAYLVNTYKLESRPLYVLPALTLHEGVPGHHLQIMLAAEIDSMAPFRKNTYLSAFGEGWGLYSEYLGEEAGIYETPYEKFGRLTYEMWRACRLVVDPGMHYMGWTKQQAVDFMASNTALSLHEVNTEIDRYIGWPGQAVSYKIGELKIRELRSLAENELGDKFDIRAFHDLLLSNGSVPLKTLERIVNHYITSIKGEEH